MHARIPLLVSLGFAAVISLAGTASATPFTVDEFGNGLPFTIGLDPTGGVSGPVLIYTLPFAGTAGDFLMFDESVNGALGDVIRFDGQGHMIFYSDTTTADPADSPADVSGLPSTFSPNNVADKEAPGETGVNGVTYTPGDGNPGFDPMDMPQFTFISDVPEPDTGLLVFAGLVFAGLLGLTGWRRARA
jgi:hypothetical protein